MLRMVVEALLGEAADARRDAARKLQALVVHRERVHDLEVVEAAPGPPAADHLPQQHPKRVHV